MEIVKVVLWEDWMSLCMGSVWYKCLSVIGLVYYFLLYFLSDYVYYLEWI